MKIIRLIRAVLREIFEEAAYERFCVREGFLVGRDSYRKFLGDTKQPKMKCC
jgi:hypothetical protein